MTEYEVIVNNGQLELSEEAIELFNRVRVLDQVIKEAKAEKDSIEKPLKQAMQKNGVEKFSCEYMTATTVAPTTTQTVDIEAMKRDGIYDKYALEIPKAGYVRINYKKEKK